MKLAIVTGAQGELGTFFVKFFCQHGFNCLGLSRRKKRDLFQGESFVEIGDISKRQAHDVICSLIFDILKNLNAKLTEVWLVNNAAIQGDVGHSCDFELEAFDDCMNANVYFPLQLQKVLLSRITTDTQVSIINVVGGGANDTFPFFSPYAVSKIALARLSEQAAVEWRELGNTSWRIACCTPGFMSSGFHNNALKGKEGLPTIKFLKDHIKSKTMLDVPFTDFEKTFSIYYENKINIGGGIIHLKNDAEQLRKYIKNPDKELFKLRRIDNFNVFSGQLK